jgi:hypothetical protein
MQFLTNDIERLRIDSNGNVGIGVTSMTNKLVLPNAAYFAMQDTGGAESLAIRANTSNAMEFLTGGGERMRIDSSGNVLVGTTSANTNGITLNSGDYIYASRDGGQALFVNRDTSDGTLIDLRKDGSTVGSIGVDNTDNLTISGNSSHCGLNFSSDDVNPYKNGAYTDGTTSLGSSSTRFNNLYLGGTANVGNLQTVSSGRIFSGTGGNASSPMIANVSDTNTGIYFPAADTMAFTTGGSEALQITSDGNILGAKAFIIPNSGQTNGFYGSGEGIGIYNQNAYSSCGAHMEMATNASDGWASFYINRTWSSGSDERTFDFRINGSTVGLINTTSSGTTYTTTSDIRLKTDIQPITDATDKLMAMKPVSHKWKTDPDADAVHGFIAQEMQQIIPEAVSGDPDGETMMQMDYGRITPVLVAALQNALKEIDMLKNRITELEAK